MFDFIFNRKYLKAKKAIKAEILRCIGNEQLYSDVLVLNGENNDNSIAKANVDKFRNRREALEDVLRIIKHV